MRAAQDAGQVRDDSGGEVRLHHELFRGELPLSDKHKENVSISTGETLQ